MDTAGLLTDAFGRVREVVHETLDGITAAQLHWRADTDANTVAWLVWHLTRVQDDHVADVAGREQVWTAQGWHERFGLPLPVGDIGYGHDSDEVASVRVPDAALLLGYLDAVHASTVAFVAGLSGEDLDRVVDTRWDPPVTLGVRLVSVVSDDLQHAGQAALLRGIAERTGV
ncbi:MAG: mycothiol transferase [Actinomycetes bacterium]